MQIYRRELQLLFAQARGTFQPMLRAKLSGSTASLSSLGGKPSSFNSRQTPALGGGRGSREERATPFEVHLTNLLARVEQLVSDEQEFCERFFNLTFSDHDPDADEAEVDGAKPNASSERAGASAARHRPSMTVTAQTRLTADQQTKLMLSMFQDLDALLAEYVAFCDKSEPLSSMPLLVLLDEHVARARKRSPQLFPVETAFTKALASSTQAFNQLVNRRLLPTIAEYRLVKKLSTKKMAAAATSGATSSITNGSILSSFFAGNPLYDPNSSSILPTVRLLDEFATLAHRIFRDSTRQGDFEHAVQKLLAVYVLFYMSLYCFYCLNRIVSVDL